MKKILQFTVGIFILIAGVFGVSYLQYRFDRSDVQHAIQAVQTARPIASEDATIIEKIALSYQVDPNSIIWSSKIQSKTQGIVMVSALVPSRPSIDENKKNHEFLWQVDLVRFQVIPVNEKAKSLGEKK